MSTLQQCRALIGPRNVYIPGGTAILLSVIPGVSVIVKRSLVTELSPDLFQVHNLAGEWGKCDTFFSK